jgi:hypothetical protein
MWNRKPAHSEEHGVRQHAGGCFLADVGEDGVTALVVSATQMVVYVLKGHDFSRAVNSMKWAGL